ncbi:hypothetical protein OKA04_17895 [Luteolibacter flavescens]|uniref:Uncharacterized protein n=1 Tax=Luteolibacter flavescens TaxID=1859460 RepID=A0ABT3FSQ1_9BACT|nr:hypothetical protein [Luteolibacter flavescens]MCW1886616.1 hypothetical protein [Luteolibacter flavescens]
MPHDKQPPPKKKRPPAYYWWALANVVALCLAVISWLGCLHVFRHPEIPRNYEFLKMLKRVDPPEPLEPMQAPAGESADPRAFYRRYAGLTDEALQTFNAALMRNYLLNLKEPKLIQYAEGDYLVKEVRKLGPDDLFHPGFAVRAQAMIAPDEFSQPAPWPVVLEYLFPTDNEEAAGWILPGDSLSVAKFPNCAMLLHASKVTGEDTPVMILTVVPIAFGDFTVGKEKKERKFVLRAPAELNPAGPLPVFPPEEQQ